MSSLYYTGDKLSETAVVIKRLDGSEETIQPYLPDSKLKDAVNLALLLKRPLLLMGEPGSGKSRLAQALAYELYHQTSPDGQVTQDYRNFYKEWFIKSTSKAQEGLYTFDAIQRLADAQIAKTQEDRNELKNLTKYISKRSMGLAFENSISLQKRTVLLIDEIDKADIDFPNDLLNELDRSSFQILETGEVVRALYMPIVIITSNAEKDLPDAFLRRCLFHYIDPFDKEDLERIVTTRFYTGPEFDNELVTLATDIFLKIRTEINDNKDSVGKNVSTAELLDWFEALKRYCELHGDNSLHQEPNYLLEQLKENLSGNWQIPFKYALLKNLSTILHFEYKQSAV